MPGTPTTRYNLPTMAGTDIGNTIDEYTVSLAGAIDPLLAPSEQGLLASRPTSTGGSPSGKAGRTYMATDVGVLFRDNGTGWDTVLTGVGHAALLGLTADGVTRRGKAIISTPESRTNVAYGLMPTPDRVQNVVLPTDGLIAVAYQATWQESVNGAALAAIFIGANQLKILTGASSPVVQEVALNLGLANNDGTLSTFVQGLNRGSLATYTGDVTTGQVVGSGANATTGGVCYIFAAAGTYDVSIQFKASSGSVTAKNRKLWVWTSGF